MRRRQPPQNGTPVTAEQVDRLAALLSEIAGNWEIFVGLLGVQNGIREQIKSDNAGKSQYSQKCLIEAVHHWVRSDDNPTYEKISSVLINESGPIINKPLARKVTEFSRSTKCMVNVPHHRVEKTVCGSIKKCVLLLAVTSVVISGSLLIVYIFFLPTGQVTPTPTTDKSKAPEHSHHQTESNDDNDLSFDLEKLIMTPGATGPDVVETCVKKINSAVDLNFPSDNKILRRIAYVMSKDGTEIKRNHLGGIWQVSEFAFEDTGLKGTSAHYRLPSKYIRIREAFGVNWPLVKYEDLDIPFYSALAARLYLSNFGERIPQAAFVEEQAQYWHYIYMRGSHKVTEKTFMSAVAELQD